jgi:hypothetical protein
MIDTQQETNTVNQKKLYNDALYLHLIHNGYTPKRAEREALIRMNSQNENYCCFFLRQSNFQ